MIILAHTETFEDCPNKCKGLSYLHDNQEEKTCGICGKKWNIINNEKVQFAIHCQCGCRVMNDELIKKFNKYYCPKCDRLVTSIGSDK
jgi:hypothetical protein